MLRRVALLRLGNSSLRKNSGIRQACGSAGCLFWLADKYVTGCVPGLFSAPRRVKCLPCTNTAFPAPFSCPPPTFPITSRSSWTATAAGPSRVCVRGQRGVEALNRVVEAAARAGIERLTVFAFSSENWRRPAAEVSMLMKLFAQALRRWCEPLAEAGVRLRVIGDRTAFSDTVREAIAENEAATAGGTRRTTADAGTAVRRRPNAPRQGLR